MDERELWGEVRSWSHDSFTDEVDRLSMLESIFERSDVPPAEIEGVSQYLRRALSDVNPTTESVHDPRVLEAWLRGQLLEVLRFVHPNSLLMDALTQEKPWEHYKELVDFVRSQSYSRAPDVFAYGTMSLESAQRVTEWLEEEERYEVVFHSGEGEGRSRAVGARSMKAAILRARVLGGVCEVDARHVNARGARGGMDVELMLDRSGGRLRVLIDDSSWTRVDCAWLFELLVQISLCAPDFYPEFAPNARIRRTRRALDSLWMSVGRIRLMR